jgi:tetratricopeptide (TPR) repeat protein
MVMKARRFLQFFARLLVVFAALVGLAGCAVQNAIDAGNAFVEQREYRRALAEYERAAKIDPDSDEARRLVAQITPFALDEAEADMQAELTHARYEQAMTHVAYVRRYDAQRAEALSGRVRTQMHTHVEAHMAKGDMLKAYPLAVRAAKLFPDMPGLDSMFQRLRAHYVAQSEAHVAAGRYADALASLDVIERHEPHMKASLKERRARIRGKWADTVVAKAVSAEQAEELGAAAALYGRAYEIAGREPDGDAMRRVMRVLREDGAFQLKVDYDGDVTRRQAISKLATPLVTAIEGVTIAKADDALSMRANVTAGRASCDESYTTSTRSKDYVAGTRQVPNPAYDQLSTDIDNETVEVNVLSSKVNSKEAQVSRLEARLRRCERRQQAARNNGKDRRQIPDCNPPRTQLSNAKSELSSLKSKLGSAQSRLSSLTSMRASTPRTLTEDVVATFTYEVHHHKRTCGVALTAALEPAWSGPEKHQLSGSAVTRDNSHPGHPERGIPLDPKSFPRTDRDLVAAADRDAAKDLAGLVGKKVRSYYRAMADRALALEKSGQADDRVAAVDMYVAIVGAGGSHLDESREKAVEARLRALYGLESVDTLRK